MLCLLGLSRFLGSFKIKSKLQIAQHSQSTPKTHSTAQICHSCSHLWPHPQLGTLFSLVINQPNFPSLFKGQCKYHWLGENFHVLGEFKSSPLYSDGSCLHASITLFPKELQLFTHVCLSLCWSLRSWRASIMSYSCGIPRAWPSDRHSTSVYWMNGKVLSETHVLCQPFSSNETSGTELKNTL